VLGKKQGRGGTCIEKHINYLFSTWTKREGEEIKKSRERSLIPK